MTNFLRILHLEDNPSDADLLAAILSADGIACEMNRVDTRQAYVGALEKGGYDLIISDYTIPAFDGLSALSLAQDICPDVPFMFVSGTIGEEVAIESLRHGARDYVLKNRLSHLGAKIRRTLKEAREHSLRKVAERALHESEHLFRSVWNNSRDGMRLTDRYGMIAAVNDAYCRLTGMPASELIGNAFHVTEVTDLNQSDLQEDYVIRFAGRKMAARLERQATFRNGKTLMLEISNNFIEAEDREPLLLSIFRDCTERHHAEARIRNQAMLLDKAQDAIWAMHAQQQIYYWNKSAERLYGWNFNEISGKCPAGLLFASDDLQAAAARKTVLEKGEWTGELTTLTRNGVLLIVESRWTMITDPDDGPGSILVVNTDISEKKKLQTQYLSAQKLESIGTLACGIAHDISNTLSPILLVAHMLREKTTNPDDLRLLNVLETSAQRGADMVKQVLSFARGGSGESKPVLIKNLLAEMEQMARQTFPRNVEISSHVSDDLWQVHGDTGQLHQVMLNLIVNARDAMPQGGKLDIHAANAVLNQTQPRPHPDAQPGTFVQITISDTGTGIAPEILDKIFDPFFTTKPQGRGSGLGLSAVLGLIKGHSGFITVESMLGRGSRFRVHLPAQPAEPLQRPSPDSPPNEGDLILLVEDETLVRDVIQKSLEHFKFRVLPAANGQQAIKLFEARQKEIKLVLTDMMMPVMDGHATIRAIRKLDSRVNIIAISGVTGNESQFHAPELKVNAFLAKPFPMDKLVATIRGLLNTPA